jgi:hypothetical protein
MTTGVEVFHLIVSCAVRGAIAGFSNRFWGKLLGD